MSTSGVFSTSEGTMSTLGDVQYIGGIPWVRRGDILCTLRDVRYVGGYRDACGEIP